MIMYRITKPTKVLYYEILKPYMVWYWLCHLSSLQKLSYQLDTQFSYQILLDRMLTDDFVVYNISGKYIKHMISI